MRSKRLEATFHVLKAIRRIVDQTQEAIDAAIEHPDNDRAFVDELRTGLLDEAGIYGMHLVFTGLSERDVQSFVERIASPVSQLHAICHGLISERETLAKALESIRRELELVDIPPRTQNRGKGARRSEPGSQGGSFPET